MTAGDGGDGGTATELHCLVRTAARAAGCSFAAFYILIEDRPAAASLFDAGRCMATRHGWWQAVGPLVPPAGVVDVTAAAAPVFRARAGFVAAMRVQRPDGALGGVLLLADARAHGGLGRGQAEVLETLALQLGAWMDLRDMQAVAHAGQQQDEGINRLRLLESVVVHAKDAILITEAEPVDLPGPRILYCNAAFTAMTGYTEAEILGKTPRLLQSPDVNRAELDRLRLALERWEPVEVELHNIKKDGTPFWVELSIVPVEDEHGMYTHWVSIQRDVTERRQVEDVKLRARIAELENRALEVEIAERKRTEEYLFHAAYHDDLTQLRNRAFFMDRLERLLDHRMTQGPDGAADRFSAVLFLDLDGFKLVNDSLGHRTGDLLLTEVARRLRADSRPDDILARVGGDEFAVLIERPDGMAGAVQAAEAILAALQPTMLLDQHVVFCSCSIGIVQATAAHAEPEALLRDADIAMYAAKTRGPGGYAIFDASMHESAVAALALQTDLRHALARDEFHLDYQPICNPGTRCLSGIEALIRWRHPVRGLVCPGDFIPLAEELGLIRDIGRWALRAACVQAAGWFQRHPRLDFRLNVNVSGVELRDPTFLADLRAVLEATGLPPWRLQLEITESVFLRRPELMGGVLRSIRAMGVRVALDDFGTGYSSLGYLDRYEIDAIKIDRSFISRMLDQRRAMAILDGIVRLGLALKVDVVAEGVETEVQLQMLHLLGCTAVQGYLLARPMPAAAVEARFNGPL